MRTDPGPEATPDGVRPLSRRTFLLVGASVAGTTVAGSASGEVGDTGESIDVAATEPYAPSVRAVADTSDGPVRVRQASEFTGQDVFVAGRPTNADGVSHEAAVDGRAALGHAGGEWRECLSRSDVESELAGDAPVETWSEVDHGRIEDAAFESAARPDRRTEGTSVLVRGTRAYQYAEGRGGVGYYDVAPDAIGHPVTLAADAAVPVARIAYVAVDRSRLADDAVSGFLERFRRRTAVVDDVASDFADPGAT